MTTKTPNRYDLANLPISATTRKGLTKENIDQIGAIGRMLLLQDEVHDEQFGDIKLLLQEQKTESKLRFDKIDERFTSIDSRLDNMEKGATEREIRISILEKHDSLLYRSIYGAILITIGILCGWVLHTLIS
jgi:hypothetical protein